MNIFESNQSSNGLNEEKSERFHHIVAKLLYISKRARPDIALTVSHMYTRASKSIDNDWEKLRRLLRCIKGTIEMIQNRYIEHGDD